MKKLLHVALMLCMCTHIPTHTEVEIVNATPFRILFKYYTAGNMYVWGRNTDAFFIGEVIEPEGTVIKSGEEYLAFDTVNKKFTGYDGKNAPEGIKPILHPEEGVPLKRVVGSIKHNADGCLIKTRYEIYFDKYEKDARGKPTLTGEFEKIDQGVYGPGCYRWVKITPKLIIDPETNKAKTTVDFTV